MNYEQIMLDCLKLATEQKLTGDAARQEAARMFAQITGRTYESIIGKPMQTTTPPKAEVVGRDGEIPKFKDYLKD